MKKGGLGKGLAALIPSETTHNTTKSDDSAINYGSNVDVATLQEIPIDDIAPNPKQPRQVFDHDALEELVFSIKECGLLQPIVVRKVSRETPYEIVMGERRWRAAQRAQLKTITCIVRSTSDNDLLRDALLENIHRVQLNPLEEAAAYEQLLEEFQVSQDQLAQRIGRSRPTITNTIRLLNLPVGVQKRVAAGILSAGHARVLLRLVDRPEELEVLAKRIVAEGLSVRAVEEITQNRPQTPKKKSSPTVVDYSHYSDTLEKKVDTTVKIQGNKDKGKITIAFSGEDDLQRIISLLTRG